MIRFDDLERQVKEQLSEKRFLHSLRTSIYAATLCKEYGADEEKGRIAGLLHDMARERSSSELITFMRNEDGVAPWERKRPSLLHGKVGAIIARDQFHVTDPDILDAIADHVTGRPGMKKLSKIIFIADYCEPGRKHVREELRRLIGRESPDKILFIIVQETLQHLKEKGRVIAEPTIELLNELEKKVNCCEAQKRY